MDNTKATEAAFAGEERNGSNVKKKKSGVIYLHTSTGKQDATSSLQAQRSNCLRYCELNNISIRNVFCDHALTNSNDQLDHNKVFEYAVTNCVDHIVVNDYMRISRSIEQFDQLVKLLEPSGISILTVKRPEQNLTTIENLLSSRRSSLAKYESEVHSTRTRDGMKHSKQQGKMVHRPPVGYKICRPNLYTSTAIDRTTSHFVKRAFELFASGKYSVKEVNEKLTEMGLENPRTQKPYLPASTKRMLSNPIYTGKVWVDDEVGFVIGNFEPIVDEDLYAKVQEIFRKLNRAT